MSFSLRIFLSGHFDVFRGAQISCVSFEIYFLARVNIYKHVTAQSQLNSICLTLQYACVLPSPTP